MGPSASHEPADMAHLYQSNVYNVLCQLSSCWFNSKAKTLGMLTQALLGLEHINIIVSYIVYTVCVEEASGDG